MFQSLPIIYIVFQSRIGGYEIVKYVPSGWNFIVYIKNKAKYYLGGCMFRYIIRWTEKMKRMLMVLSFKNKIKRADQWVWSDRWELSYDNNYCVRQWGWPSDKGLMLKKSALDALYRGQFILAIQLIKSNYLDLLTAWERSTFGTLSVNSF